MLQSSEEQFPSKIHNLLGSWLSKFCQQSLRMTGDETDTTAIDALWQLARSAQDAWELVMSRGILATNIGDPLVI